jgi:hypothetical protein
MDWGKFREKRYAQTDEESVILNLVDHFNPKKFVVDVGAGDGVSISNSRLLMDMGWDACRFDVKYGGEADPTLHKVMVRPDNVVRLLDEYDVPKDFGLLTIDIDGVDLYVLHALLRGYSPSIVVFEFNACRPTESFDVVRYDPEFKWDDTDYYGASWSAFDHVLGMNGYQVVHHSNSLNGYAVDAALLPERCPTAPVQNKYHRHNPNGKWLDARDVFWPIG